MVLLLVALTAMSSSSSDRDERRNPRDRYRDNRRRASNRHYREDDDENDAYDTPYHPPYRPSPYAPYGDPYGHRPQGAGFVALVRSFFAGILAISVVAAGVYYKYNMDAAPPEKIPTVNGTIGAVSENKEEPMKIAAPVKENESQKNPHMICLKKTDYVTFRDIQKIYPKRKIEAYLDKADRYWICIFAMTSEELDETVALLRLREADLHEHGLELVYYKTSDFCSGKMVREKGTDIWFCQE
ncbi:MAG: DUF3824 domain-containing protein [Phycisphaerae bacterium]|nr:DUF3824 domain-containing protein [Saprospiraceae bacterium]